MSVTLPLVIDCDPGVDDAMALYFAMAHPAFELLGVTTTFGNVSVAQATRNAMYLCGLAARQVPVCAGLNSPMRKAPRATDPEVHGADGLGNLPERHSIPYAQDERSAARFIVDMARAHPGRLALATLGPLGNLAQALRLEPNLPQLIARVVVMGGSIAAPGNVSPVAEANIWHDPHAADIVLTAGLPLTLVGLDVTQRMPVPLTVFERIARGQNRPATDVLLHAARHYAGFYGKLEPELARQQACLAHDAVALMALAQPGLFQTQRGRVRVVTEGLAEGQTIMDRREHIPYPQAGWGDDVPRIDACMEIDSAACLRLFEATLSGPWLGP